MAKKPKIEVQGDAVVHVSNDMKANEVTTSRIIESKAEAFHILVIQNFCDGEKPDKNDEPQTNYYLMQGEKESEQIIDQVSKSESEAREAVIAFLCEKNNISPEIPLEIV